MHSRLWPMTMEMPSSSRISRCKATVKCFIWLDLAAGKLPVVREGIVFSTLAHQYLLAPADYRDYHVNHFLHDRRQAGFLKKMRKADA